MSQHFLKTTCKGQKICVTLGYDRPLRRFFLLIHQIHSPARGSYKGCDGNVDFNDVEVWNDDRQLTSPEFAPFHAELRVRFDEMLQLRNPA